MVNWDSFAHLPGAADNNFEMLCRALIRRHYGKFGDFFALANQPGVEFHLKLHAQCSLGESGRWFGWQCRWYDLPSGQAIGTTRRKKIQKAIATSEAEIPDLTDWVLWTRRALTKSDQKWFFGIQTHMRLHLWTGAEVEEHLSGPAEIFRQTYFGELVLTPEILEELHEVAVAPIKRRWQPEVHQVVNAERDLRRALGGVEAWSNLRYLADQLASGVEAMKYESLDLNAALTAEVDGLAKIAMAWCSFLNETLVALERGDYELLLQRSVDLARPDRELTAVLHRFRAARHRVALTATNLVADVHQAVSAISSLREVLLWRFVAVVADAGCGKTELAAQLTAPDADSPSGVLLYGRDFQAGSCLDDLARRVAIQGRPAPTFEALVAAVDAAGQRACRRLPIVIDGLNEAEDPRDWKSLLASAAVTLQRYPFVMMICTLRSAFTREALPDGTAQLEIPDFEHDSNDALRRYFKHYKIDPADALLPARLLRHPLTLRMFCEVTNPERKKTVGVEAMPDSLTALFDRYLEQVTERVVQLAPRSYRHFESDVRTALNTVGFALWEAKARSLDIGEMRSCIGDDARPWNESMIRALECDGVLLRVPSDQPSCGRLAIVYDALAGHLVADALLDQFGGRGFEKWLREPATEEALTGQIDPAHPLAADIFRALVGLVPSRMHRRQLWPMLEGSARSQALHDAAWLEAGYLDRETVSELAGLIVKHNRHSRDLFDRLWTTRAAPSHPLNADFLDSLLRPLTIAERDLRWTEWIRRSQAAVIEDLVQFEQRWQCSAQARSLRDRLRARWAMWTLTSTVRVLRDHATRALYWFGCGDPKALFELAINALEINDPYVPERMLAACYGAAISLWADPRGGELREAIPAFASTLVDQMFVPGAPYGTQHTLIRDYALGVISLAMKVSPDCIPASKLVYLKAPFDAIPSPFRPACEIEDGDVAGAKSAIYMDFGNYTLGRLISSRRNYDYGNTTYKEILRQIECRIVEFGYSPTLFSDIDKSIGEASWRAVNRGAPKTDRYGKKYSWIAYFEMYGLRLANGLLSGWHDVERTSDADIDPSFPEPVKSWKPSLPELFTSGPTVAREWLTSGPTPDYEHLMYIEEVDGRGGPWVLLNGFIEQSSEDDGRQLFTFLRGLFVAPDKIAEIFSIYDALDYPGNDAIPRSGDDYYTFAGEIPWSRRFGSTLRDSDGKAKRNLEEAFVLHDGKQWLPGIPVEIPVHGYAWESHHSMLNQASGVLFPAPAICEQLSLQNRQSEWDLYDSSGNVATLYREYVEDEELVTVNLAYIRADLCSKYLESTEQSLIWFVWGERGFEYRTMLLLRDTIEDLHSDYVHIHRNRSVWTP